MSQIVSLPVDRSDAPCSHVGCQRPAIVAVRSEKMFLTVPACLDHAQVMQDSFCRSEEARAQYCVSCGEPVYCPCQGVQT